jgi:cobalamin biosynthesis Co2+ chelatase CbiK
MKFLIILIAVFTSYSFSASCGPDSVVCQYEKMFEEYESLRATFPNEKALVKSLLRKYFTGESLSSQINYLEGIPFSGYDSLILFPSPIKKVLKTRVEQKSNEMVKVYRTVTEFTKAFDEIGNPVALTVSYEYTVVRDLSSWKISRILVL